jgi:hypothetical protein
MLSVRNNPFMLIVFMVFVVMLSVTNKPFMLSVVMLNVFILCVVMQSVVAPKLETSNFMRCNKLLTLDVLS